MRLFLNYLNIKSGVIKLTVRKNFSNYLSTILLVFLCLKVDNLFSQLNSSTEKHKLYTKIIINISAT